MSIMPIALSVERNLDDKSGQLQLKQHSETQTHKKNSALSSSQSKLVVTKSQTTSSASSSQLGISTFSDEIAAAEIIWAGKVAALNLSI
jgi:BRCT domain type II-containing protein